MNKRLFRLTVCLSTMLHFPMVNAENDLVAQAEQCTTLTSRLERLSCFDHLFKTPSDVVMPQAATPNVPLSWQRAFDSLSQYQDGQASHLTVEGDDDKGNAWITLVALNQNTKFDDNAKPVLLMSCIDNLSRVELAFPSAIDDPRIQVSIANMQAQSWRSDDLGLLFSSGRGMPAIDMMKAMAREKRLVLRSNSPFVDGLQFDAGELSQSLIALKTHCGW
ncbi:MAG: type VI secretion system-associated protein VasI [Vibrio ordalii]|uniref:type VI secretion system-associated protein VasI n=1 Tax=Vibrio ordalii TaxID=28174 RepID=UPI003F2FE6E6